VSGGDFRPIRDYAVIGDGRIAALVSSTGSIDWLCLPNLDSPSVFGAILDLDRGGAFTVQPSIPFTSERRYQPDSNLLETTFTTASGVVRLVDSVNLPEGALCPLREIARTIVGVEGEVPMYWSASPRFEYGRWAGQQGHRGNVPVATCGGEAVAFPSWNAGTPAPATWTSTSTRKRSRRTCVRRRLTKRYASSHRES